MQTNRRQLVEQGTQLTKNIQEAAISLKKARKQFDQSNKDLSKQRAALEKLQAQRQLTEGGDLGKIQAKMRAAEERFTGSRQTFRLQEEALKSLQAKLYTQELPRIMSRLQQQEVQRSRESLSYILGLIELERRCAVMNENYANDMALKLKHINLVEDERRFTRTYMSIPIAPPPPPPPPSLTIAIAEPSQPAMRTMGEIPRTVSMPPAYESQQQSMPILQRHATGSAILGMVVTSEEAHSRYPTAIMMGEGEPSQPATMISQC